MPAIPDELLTTNLQVEESLFQPLRSYALREQHPPHCWASQVRKDS